MRGIRFLVEMLSAELYEALERKEHMMQKTPAEKSKRVWVSPKVTQIKAGSAESNRGSIADGGGGFQGS